MPLKNQKSSISKNSSEVKKRLFEETIEILDSDDDFDVPKLRALRAYSKSKSVDKSPDSPEFPKSSTTKLSSKKKGKNPAGKSVASSSTKLNSAALKTSRSTEYDFCSTSSSSSRSSNIGAGGASPQKSIGSTDVGLGSELKFRIGPTIVDVEEECNLVGIESSNSVSGKSCIEEPKDAWKGLMQRMQHNQKTTTTTTASASSKGWKGVGKGSRKALETLKNKPNNRTQSRSVVYGSEVERNEGKKLDGKNLAAENLLENLESPPKKPKLEVYNMDSTKVKETKPSVIPENEPCSSSSISIRPGAKVPTMFLKPEERAALALAEKLQKSKIQCDPNSVLSLLSEEPTVFSSAKETTDQFDGNVVKLNDYVPTEDPYGGTKTKVCPFYKKLPGTRFSVDAFNYGLIPGIEVYFLSHFHSDHYIGLTKKFCKTLICSPPTANLIKMKINVADTCIRRLQLNKTYMIDGVEVVLINANHCPGSVMFIFRLPNGITYFHTGDFRFTTDMLDNHFLQGLKIDNLYLDTTYCDPKYDFPTQSDAITELIGAVKRRIEFRPKTLILCGSYLIGKERVYFSLAAAIQSKVYGNSDKRRIINALENPRYSAYLTDKEELASIHVINMFSINPKFLSEYLATRQGRYTNIIGIKPSGWQFSSSGSGTSIKSHYNDTVTIIGVPYSEHSSFSELAHFVSATKPRKIQPTVNVGSAVKRTAMMEHIEKWLQ